MPEELERQLKQKAAEKFPGDQEKQNAYVYGTLQKIKQEQEHPETHWYWRARKRSENDGRKQ